MFTEYSKEEIKIPDHLHAAVAEGEDLEVEVTAATSNTNNTAKENVAATYQLNNNDVLYNLEGENLW